MAPLIAENFEIVHIDVGEGDKNQDLMALYRVPMSKGIRTLAVLDATGKRFYSRQCGEFANARPLARRCASASE
jgi:hypothetical protein